MATTGPPKGPLSKHRIAMRVIRFHTAHRSSKRNTSIEADALPDLLEVAVVAVVPRTCDDTRHGRVRTEENSAHHIVVDVRLGQSHQFSCGISCQSLPAVGHRLNIEERLGDGIPVKCVAQFHEHINVNRVLECSVCFPPRGAIGQTWV